MGNFRNFRKKGQPRKADRNFRNDFPEISVPFDFEPEFSEIFVEWNAPNVTSFRSSSSRPVRGIAAANEKRF